MAEFLRTRRKALTPGDVGLPTGCRRRVRGLRREEVAQLAGMSVDYYSRFEQGRGAQPSAQLLSALAKTLRLNPDERDHLYRLAGHPAPDRTGKATLVRPPLLQVLDQLDDCAAFICDDLLVFMAQNRLSVLLVGDQRGDAGVFDSVVWRWFTESRYREVLSPEDHERQARLYVADLRATWSRRRGDDEVQALVNGLLEGSEEFRLLWQRHEVGRPRKEVQKTIVHPLVGRIPVDVEILATADVGQRLVILSAPPGSESHDKLKLLSMAGDHAVGA
jgi:transcriptional regulator with XRE-family HTH domain